MIILVSTGTFKNLQLPPQNAGKFDLNRHQAKPPCAYAGVRQCGETAAQHPNLTTLEP